MLFYHEWRSPLSCPQCVAPDGGALSWRCRSVGQGSTPEASSAPPSGRLGRQGIDENFKRRLLTIEGNERARAGEGQLPLSREDGRHLPTTRRWWALLLFCVVPVLILLLELLPPGYPPRTSWTEGCRKCRKARKAQCGAALNPDWSQQTGSLHVGIRQDSLVCWDLEAAMPNGTVTFDNQA